MNTCPECGAKLHKCTRDVQIHDNVFLKTHILFCVKCDFVNIYDYTLYGANAAPYLVISTRINEEELEKHPDEEYWINRAYEDPPLVFDWAIWEIAYRPVEKGERCLSYA